MDASLVEIGRDAPALASSTRAKTAGPRTFIISHYLAAGYQAQAVSRATVASQVVAFCLPLIFQ